MFMPEKNKPDMPLKFPCLADTLKMSNATRETENLKAVKEARKILHPFAHGK